MPVQDDINGKREAYPLLNNRYAYAYNLQLIQAVPAYPITTSPNYYCHIYLADHEKQ